MFELVQSFEMVLVNPLQLVIRKVQIFQLVKWIKQSLVRDGLDLIVVQFDCLQSCRFEIRKYVECCSLIQL